MADASPSTPRPAGHWLFTQMTTVETQKQRKTKPWIPPAIGMKASVVPEYFKAMPVSSSAHVIVSPTATVEYRDLGVMTDNLAGACGGVSAQLGYGVVRQENRTRVLYLRAL